MKVFRLRFQSNLKALKLPTLVLSMVLVIALLTTRRSTAAAALTTSFPKYGTFSTQACRTSSTRSRSSSRRIQLSTQRHRQLDPRHFLSTMSRNDESYTMTDDEKYLFDLNGFIVVRNVLTEEEVLAANRAIDKHKGEMSERSAPDLRNAKKNSPFYGEGPGRKDLGGVLEWGDRDSAVFRSILTHARLRPYYDTLLGKGYRMDHLPLVIAQDRGAEGFQLHGGTVGCTTGEYNHHLAYTYSHGTMRCALLACNVMLTDHNAGDGGFCVVPGSHKSNFKMPSGMVDGLTNREFISQPVTKAGDVVLFSEGTVHGALPWTSQRQRKACLFRFAPATCAYGRSYFGSDEGRGTWPAGMYEGLDEAQRAVLEPPYANRLDRPNIEEDGTVIVTTRNVKKKEHDRTVFGTKYF